MIIWMVLIVIFVLLRPESFATSANASTILGSQTVLVVLTMALLIPLTAGDYDLSIAATLTMSSMVVAILNVQHSVPIAFSVFAAIAVGAAIGFVNGAVVVYVGIDSFIVTLGTSSILAGMILWMSGSVTISGVSQSLVNGVVGTRFLGVPVAFYYGLVVACLLWYVLEYTAVGKRLLFVGRGREVAKLTGLRVGRIRLLSLVASGALGAVAGVLYVGTTGAADPTSGHTFLLPAFAAAFLGATTIRPGRFNPFGSVLAVYFLVTGITGLQLLGAQGFVQQMFYGSALIVAVSLAEVARRRKVRRAELKLI